MDNGGAGQFDRWGVDDLLDRYPGLAIVPGSSKELVLEGEITFCAAPRGGERICDTYLVRVAVPPSFPSNLPWAYELRGRVPQDFHVNPDNTLCLGSPLKLHLALYKDATLAGFLELCVVPFLYGVSYREKHGEPPFGELDHGDAGLMKEYMEHFCVSDKLAVVQMLQLCSMKKRVANKRPCPCNSGKRLGRCHHLALNFLRLRLGRSWFRREQINWSTRRAG